MEKLFMILLLASVCGSSPRVSWGQLERLGRKVPEPDRAAQERAEQVIKSTYRAEYARREPREMRDFALKLFQQGMETNDDLAAKFVLYREASLLAAKAGEIQGASAVLDQMHREFDTRMTHQLRDVLQTAVSATLPASAQKLVTEAAMISADLALATDDLPIARELLELAEAASAKLGSASLKVELKSRRRELDAVRDWQAEYERALAKLQAAPDDASATFTVARHLCFVKGDWAAGLPMFARSADSKLKTLAARDLALPADATAQAELAAAWWDLAQENTGLRRRRILIRTCRWYNAAIARLSGLTLTLAKDRVAATIRQYPELTLLGDVSLYAAHAGLWDISYTNGATRRYVIDPRGTVYHLTDDSTAVYGRLLPKDRHKYFLRLVGDRSRAVEELELKNTELIIDHYNPPGKLSCMGIGKLRTLPEARSGATNYTEDFSAFAGIWFVPYTKGDLRLYIIGPKGSAVGSGAHQYFEGRMRRNGEDVLLDCGENKLERVKIQEGMLRSEHYFPASNYPNGSPLLHGRGTCLWK